MRPAVPVFRRALLALALLLIGGPQAATAQFGRNKVQYTTFDFSVLKTQHFDIYYYPAEKQAVEEAARLAERWYTRLSTFFEHQLKERQPIILYASHPDFEQTNAISGELDEGTGGVTEYLKRRVVLPFGASLAETDHVLGHELVHAFQYDMTSRGNASTGAAPGALYLPLWFIEGMAEYLSQGPEDELTGMWMRDATLRKLPRVNGLDDPSLFPYRWGEALWAYIGGRWGDPDVTALIKTAGRTGNLELAMERTLGVDEKKLSDGWHEAFHEAYDSLKAPVTTPVTDYARLLFGHDQGGGLNVSPALSPDGSKMAFLSARDLFSIDLFLADVKTGKIIRKLVTSSTDPHFESLQFINSAGAFDHQGQYFAFGGVVNGSPTLTVVNVENGQTVFEHKFPDLGEIYTPTFSPDGQRVAFSAIVGGLSDLFVYDLRKQELSRLTNDAYADLQPAWSPDGKTIAFVTDRFTTDLDKLASGDYRLGLIDPSSGTITPVKTFSRGKNINPQWTPDGKDIVFISNQNGISNIYRVALADSTVTQLTNVYTGVSGIIALSPALSVASQSGQVAFNVFEKGEFHLYTADSTMLAGHEVKPPLAAVSPAMLPPVDRVAGPVSNYIANDTLGLPKDTVFPDHPYSSSLTLDYVARPEFAVGASTTYGGVGVAGGTALYWSDMLGEHNLTTALSVNGTIKDIGGGIGYENTRRRLNWGVVAEQIPYQFATYSIGFRPDSNISPDIPFNVYDITRIRVYDRQLMGLLSYPLSRVERLEFSAGIENLGFSEEIESDYYDAFGNLQDVTRNDVATTLTSLTMGVARAALVYDNATYGATSPILGSRWRLDASPSVGSLEYASLGFDYRKYIVPVRPFTIAGRVIHYGRYGPDAESPRIGPYFLGYQSGVRGYDYGSFDGTECHPNGTDSCPVFTQLFGTKLFAANAEIRFPLLGLLGVGDGFYGFFPIELGAFADAGLAWNDFNRPQVLSFLDKTAPTVPRRDWVTSAGGLLRINVFGYAIAELDYVRPFGRPDKGWMWQFGISPGGF